jgi:hypothetical protein
MWLVLWGLGVLLLSCEKEESLKGSGEMVAVNISLGGIVYNGNETVTRGYVEEGETVTVALGEGLFMHTRIEKNRVAEMRAEAGEALEDGVRVRVVAYSGTTVASTAEYEVVSGDLAPIGVSGFLMEEGEYTFVAYSYNSTTSPAYPASPATTVTVASPNDLLWGSKKETVSATNKDVTITMKHKFAQVRVEATMTGADIIDIDGVTVLGNSADLTVATGGLAKNAAAVATAVPFSRWDGENTQTVTSDSVVIYTGVNNIYVDLGTITIDGYNEPFTNAKAVFNKELEEGYSYTLVISFKKTLWAKSNIYWDEVEQRLTFDTYENSHQGYQGVFFKYGSLVGVSPARTSGSADFSGSTPIYVPIVNATLPNSTWKVTDGNSTASDTDIDVNVRHNYTEWSNNEYIVYNETPKRGDIPFLDPRYDTQGSVTFGRNNRFVIDDDWNKYEVYKEFRGDICQYLSTKTRVVEGDWRLPTSAEFGTVNTTTWAASNPTTTPNADGWIKGIDPWPSENTAAGYADGTADLLDDTAGKNGGNAIYGSAINNQLGVVFPSSGYRNYDGGPLYHVGLSGYLWSGSTNVSTYGYRLYFNGGNVYPSYATDRSFAFPVRCVRN